jgi:hypothetical protein
LIDSPQVGSQRTGRLVQIWGLALFLGAVGLSVIATLMPEPPDGRHLTNLEVILHLHLPWTVISAVMALTSGLLWQDRWTGVGVLWVPITLTVIGAMVDVPGEASTVLFLVEGVFGAVLGWIVAEVLKAVRPDELTLRPTRTAWRSVHRQS